MPILLLRTVFVLSFVLSLAPARAQDVSIARGGRVEQCGGTFTDGGGASGDHAPAGTRQTLTLCADGNGGGTHVALEFTRLAVAGVLSIYDGEDTNAPLLRELSAQHSGERPRVAATAANASGCLTVTFNSTGVAPGWEAAISCVSACQPIVAELVATQPAADERGYLNVCIGEPITFTGRGQYPQNGTVYQQTDADATFTWSFATGETRSGTEVTYSYDVPGAYVVKLTITDPQGCQNTNVVTQRVRVAPPPAFSFPPPPPVTLCPGETVTLTTDGSGPYNFSPQPTPIRFSNAQTFSETIEIPDELGRVYSSGLEVNLFEPGDRLISGNDIEAICVTMEHSFMGDLDMYVACPDGQRLYLLANAVTIDDPVNVRLGYGLPNSGPNPPETYCWTPDGTETAYDVAGRQPPANPRPTLPPDRQYASLDGDFDALAGCRLNGLWTLNAEDKYALDDGTIYNWTIRFREEILPPQDNFEVPIESVRWAANDALTSYSPSVVTYRGTNPGSYQQRLLVTDSLGCTFDTLIQLQTLAPSDPACGNCGGQQDIPTFDTVVCDGASFRLLPPLPVNSAEPVVWEALAHADFEGSFGYPLTVVRPAPDSLFRPGEEFGPVCVALESEADLASAEIRVRSPSGTEVLLAPRGSLSGLVLDTCFASGTGGEWDALQSEIASGTWELLVNHSGASTLRSWSFSLLDLRPVRYQWTPTSSELSCSDCPDPVVTPTRSRRYRLTATTADGCSVATDVNIEVDSQRVMLRDSIVAGCVGARNGAILLSPDGLPDGLTYAWSTGATTRDIFGLAPGDYTLTFTRPGGCERTATYTVPEPEPLAVSVTAPPLPCGEITGGTATVAVSGGSPPYRVVWEDYPSGPTLSDLPIGRYPFTVLDALGCAVRDTAIIESPQVVEVTAGVTEVGCFNSTEGAIRLSVVGGTSPYTFTWSDGNTQPERSGLSPGYYAVTVSDAVGCEDTSSYLLSTTEPITFTSEVVGPVCPGESTGFIQLSGEGGTPPLAFSIDGVAFVTAGRFGNLPGGTYDVYVRDAFNCTLRDTVAVPAAPPFAIDLGPDLTITYGDSVTLNPILTGGSGSVDYQWSAPVSSGLSCSDCPAPTVRPDREADYDLIVVDTLGCSAEDRVRIRVRKIREVAVPSGFTPNGDGHNDRLLVHGRPGTVVERFSIFDRWGDWQFERTDFAVNDPDAGWDGTDTGGRALNGGVYLYRVTVRYEDGSRETLAGETTLIR